MKLSKLINKKRKECEKFEKNYNIDCTDEEIIKLMNGRIVLNSTPIVNDKKIGEPHRQYKQRER